MERVEVAPPGMFHAGLFLSMCPRLLACGWYSYKAHLTRSPSVCAGISNKFTKRHGANFEDTTLTAASAAKVRAERKAQRQAEAINKQQEKIETEMKKIEEITHRLHKQQMREGRRLRNRLNYAATQIQRVYRCMHARKMELRAAAVIEIQRCWRGFLGRCYCVELIEQHNELVVNHAACVLTQSIRSYGKRQMRKQQVIARQNAACLIQTVSRMHRAVVLVHELRRKRAREMKRNQAATVIQANARCFMTRLIYLDVLYLICRIQAVMRGFLIRKRLQWVSAINVEAICKFQALVRGFLVRQEIEQSRRQSFDDTEAIPILDQAPAVTNGRSQRRISIKTTSRDYVSSDDQAQLSFKESRSTQKPVSLATFDTVKRSYWLPAGNNILRRLPTIPNSRPAIVLDEKADDPISSSPAGRTYSDVRTPKKRYQQYQKARPVRLIPVEMSHDTIKSLGDSENDVQAVHAYEERMKREHELKMKLLNRKYQEKRKQELENMSKRSLENEAAERKLMEREEKMVRLLLKVQHRRTKEAHIQKQSAEQQREERERIAMTREERQMRLHLKLHARQTAAKKTAPSTQNQHNRVEVLPIRIPAESKRVKHDEERDLQDDDMSFLNIDFKVPHSMQQKARQAKKHTPNASKKRSRKKEGRDGNQERDGHRPHHREAQEHYIRDTLKAEIVEDECEFDYGNEFEDVEDETKLCRLIC